jgi:HemY protein
MRRVVFFAVVAVVVITVAWLIAGIPGHVAARFGSIAIETSAPVAILGLIILAAVLLLIWNLCVWLLSLPRRGAIWRSRRTRNLGDQSVTRLLVALAADEKHEAWREARRTRRLLGDSPYSLLLLAEAGRLSGHETEAENAFRALADRRDSRFLGLRGLLRQAMAREDWPAAMQFAKQAEDVRPGTTWLRQERAQLALKTENWAEALELVGDDDRRPAYLVAAADAEANNTRALGYAKKAWQLDPTFPPAAIAYAQRLRNARQEKRAQSIITKTWKRAPHPDLATFALAPFEDKQARAQAAKRLAGANATDVESRLLLVRTSLDAGQLSDARYHVNQLRNGGYPLQRRFYMLVAELEEAERGDTEEGRLAQREALREAAVAEPDARWQCITCRTEYPGWRPKCATCQSVASINWVRTATPAERLPAIEQTVAPV